jgi:Tol biopolymer transport system component
VRGGRVGNPRSRATSAASVPSDWWWQEAQSRRSDQVRALAWSNGRGSGDGPNIWSQPLDGGAPRQLTHFASERILRYEWSPDGKSLLYAHGTVNNDVVLISNIPRVR